MTESHALILAGGFGTRLWPFSRQECPKQFLPILGGNRSLLQETISRLLPLFPYERIWVIAKPEHKEEVLSQCRYGFSPPLLLKDRLLLEPVPKGTLAAISWAVQHISDLHGDVPIGVFPTDHYIADPEVFQKSIQLAINWVVLHDQLVVFGILPTRAETNYGYIEKGIPLETIGEQEVVNVAFFHEKPDQAQAEQYLSTGQFLWNSGIFVFRSFMLLSAIKIHLPGLYELLTKISHLRSEGLLTPLLSCHGPGTAIKGIYERMPDSSIDKGLLEPLVRLGSPRPSVVVLPCRWTWSDIGLWNTCYNLYSKDADGNVLSGKVLQKGCSGCLVRNEEDGLVAMVGVKDLIVVHKGDVTLICHKEQLSLVPQILQEIKERDWKRFL